VSKLTKTDNQTEAQLDRHGALKLKHTQNWGTREERMKKRSTIHAACAVSAEEIFAHIQQESSEESYWVDWSEHDGDAYYFSFSHNAFVTFDNYDEERDNNFIIKDKSDTGEECYRAVTEGVPQSFEAALHDASWGDPARTEFHTLTEATGAMIRVNRAVAKENIKNGAQVLRMIAVYEEKIKEGKLVRKVRLVADGRKHLIHGETFSATPSREEFLILLHTIACKDWDFYHLDEIRAFLNAERQDKEKIYAKFSGSPEYYEIIKAVYGLKTCQCTRIHQVNNLPMYL